MAKFMRKGTTKAYFATTIAASDLAPTTAEIASAESLHDKGMATIEGFTFESQTVEAAEFGSRQTPKIAGEDQTADSSIGFYEDDVTNPLRAILAKDETGYIILAPAGKIAADDEVDVFPVRVMSNPRSYTADNQAATWTANFAIDDEAAIDVAISS